MNGAIQSMPSLGEKIATRFRTRVSANSRQKKKKKANSLDPSASIRNLHPRCVLLQAGYEIGSILVRIVERAFHVGGEVHEGALKGR